MPHSARRFSEYFRSGWAFLIPYLAAYLGYAALQLPANPPARGSGAGFPSLLQVYWALHAIHFALGAIAFSHWWRTQTGRRPLLTVWVALAPWLCLLLVFWLPGLNMEWPTDPWEHLRRINEWRAADTVTAHSTWMKSGYFLPYSLTVFATGAAQLEWLRGYQAGVCLLLSWQYYRLARSLGLGERQALLFVLFTPLLFGNNVFSYYRYYGLSTSPLAHLAALAVIRLAVEATATGDQAGDSRWPRRPLPLLVLSCGLLGLLLVLNHLQATGVALLGVGAILGARWAGHRLPRIAAIVVAVAILSLAALVAAPVGHFPGLQDLAASGWLTRWHGFDLLSPSSPAFQRAWDILGLLGFMNLAAACFLLRTRPLVAWLTLFSYLLLLSPLLAVPLAVVLQGYSPEVGALTFNRLLLGIPPGLALVVLAAEALPRVKSFASSLPIAGLACLMLLSPGPDAFNRCWHALHVTPADLSQAPLLPAADSVVAPPSTENLLLGSNVIKNVLSAFEPRGPRPYFRNLHGSPPEWFSETIRAREAILDGAIPLAEGSVNRSDAWLVFHSGSFSDPPAGPAGHMTPLSAPESAWARLAGADPVVIRHETGVEVRNPAGEHCVALAAQKIPLSPALHYSVSVSIRRRAGESNRNYLAVAWYDENDNLLPASAPAPGGGDNPTGWHNGDLSYFGVIGAAAPEAWGTFTKEFGLGESAQVPRNARYFRIAAVLNDQSQPQAVVAIRDVRVTTHPAYRHWDLVVAKPTAWTTPYSMAASLSHHWLAHKVAIELAGLPELEAALNQTRPGRTGP